jgi:SNF2-related domain/Helicase conserved C-terminal domain
LSIHVHRPAWRPAQAIVQVMDLYQQLAADASLRDFLMRDAWKKYFDNATLGRAKDYANDRMIRLKNVERSSGPDYLLEFQIQGTRSKPYQTKLILSPKKQQAHFSCSCPVGWGCKHTAAAFMLLKVKLSQKIEVSKYIEEQQFEQWLSKLSSVEQETSRIKTKKVDGAFLAYCLEPGTNGSVVRLHRAVRTSSDVISFDWDEVALSFAKLPAYVPDEDIPLLLRYARLSGGKSNKVVSGADWGSLIPDLLATGRFYFLPKPLTSWGLTESVLLRAGEPSRATAIWDTNPHTGSMRPVIQWDREGLVFLPTSPLYYLDQKTGEIGPVQSELGAQALILWEQGPEIPADRVDELTARLTKSSAQVKLPVPRALESEVRPAGPPTPHFRVVPLDFQDRYGRERLLVGQLKFTYGDSPEMWPLETRKKTASFVTARAGKRIEWPRDLKAEKQAAKLLQETLPIVSLDEVFNSELKEEISKNSYCLLREPPHTASDWIGQLYGSAAQKLRDQGWIIEGDSACGLTMRDMSDFQMDLEADTNHGIDWFSLDVGYELDGKKVSLIPVIADIIKNDYLAPGVADVLKWLFVPCVPASEGFIRFPADKLLEIADQVRHLFHGRAVGGGPLRLDRLGAADIADTLGLDSSETLRALANLGKKLKDIHELPTAPVPSSVQAELRGYQREGFSWLQFLREYGLNGILADDMGLGKTLQTLTHLAAEHGRQPGKPSLIVAPTSVVPNWASEVEKFVPDLKCLVYHGADRSSVSEQMAEVDLVVTSYPLLNRDFEILSQLEWHAMVLDEAQYIKNPKAAVAQRACQMKAGHRICLSGTPMENHLGELWSLMRFLMPGYLGDEKSFTSGIRRAIERDRSPDAQRALNRRVAPLILRRTKGQVVSELPQKTEIIHTIDLTKKQTALYEAVRATMDERVRDAIAAKGLAQSQIIVLDALLKLRQICCHPQLLKNEAAKKVTESAKLDFLLEELLPTLLEEGRRILLFSQFTSMLEIIGNELEKRKITYIKLTGQTKDRASLVKKFQTGEIPIFLISLKAGGTGLNLTAADTVIHYDPWWNPAAENQATDRAHRIGQKNPVFVHKLITTGSIEARILELQKHKAALVEALLSEETTKLKMDAETLGHLLAPLDDVGHTSARPKASSRTKST